MVLLLLKMEVAGVSRGGKALTNKDWRGVKGKVKSEMGGVNGWSF